MNHKRWLVEAYDKGKYSNHKLIKDKDKKQVKNGVRGNEGRNLFYIVDLF